MNRVTCVYICSFAILAPLNIANCIDKVSKVNKMALQLTNDATTEQYLGSSKSYIDRSYAPVNKGSFDSDRIIFDRGDLYPTERPPPKTTSTPIYDVFKLNETNQQYSSNANGEYKFSLTIREGMRRIESGEFEDRNGEKVFIVRGFFENISKEGNIKITAYIFDHTGYHEIPFSFNTTDSTGIIDFRPESEEADCDLAKGEYCIDRKLLVLMVG